MEMVKDYLYKELSGEIIGVLLKCKELLEMVS